MSVQTRIVLGTLSIFNAVVLLTLGMLSVFCVNGPAGPVLAGSLWFFAGALFALSRWLRNGTEWR
jgi:hypothetical protein